MTLMDSPPTTGWFGLKRCPDTLKSLKPAQALSLLLLACAADCHGEVAPTSYEKLTEGATITPLTMKRAVAQLVEHRLVDRHRGQNAVAFRLRCAAFPRPRPSPPPQVASITTDTSEPPPAASITTDTSQIPQVSPRILPAVPQVSPRILPASRVENPEKDSTEKEGERTLFVVHGEPQAPPPQIKIYDEIFAPVRTGPLEEWRWSCITKTVGLDEGSLRGWTMACQRWLGNKQDAEKVVTLVTSYREKFQPKTGPGSAVSLGVPDEPVPEAPPPMSDEARRADWERARQRIAAIRERHRWGPPSGPSAGVSA